MVSFRWLDLYQALNAANELHDSRLGSISDQDGCVTIRLAPAFVHRSTGEPGIDEGVCEAQDCTLAFKKGEAEGEVGELLAYILEGNLTIGATEHPNMIRLPCQANSPVELTLHLADDYRRIVVSGMGLSFLFDGEVKFVEQFRSPH